MTSFENIYEDYNRIQSRMLEGQIAAVEEALKKATNFPESMRRQMVGHIARAREAAPYDREEASRELNPAYALLTNDLKYSMGKESLGARMNEFDDGAAYEEAVSHGEEVIKRLDEAKGGSLGVERAKRKAEMAKRRLDAWRKSLGLEAKV
ncbi:MAG TPA: hypothetical protein VJC07_05105 [Candidatus Nanoarchaeia archaeon]|nr:hypothetical protein [Candidatus Nanoarchaeia archaeon]